jgi:hypothetical protein
VLHSGAPRLKQRSQQSCGQPDHIGQIMRP